MASVAETMKAKVGWDESNSRKTRVICAAVGLVLLFAGVICQWVAGNDFGEIPLSTLCEAYSGNGALMDFDDWRIGKNEYYLKNGDEAEPLSLQMIAAQFLGLSATFSEDYHDYPVDQFLYSSPAFWCRFLPSCPPGAICSDGPDGRVEQAANWTRGAWKGRRISDKPAWGVPQKVNDKTTLRISCKDKATVYKAMIKSIFTDRDGEWVLDKKSDELWNAQALEVAADEVSNGCMLIKGSTGYILDLPPLLTTLTCSVCLLTLLRWFQGPFTATAAESLAVISVALTLVGFWVVEMQTDEEFMQSYMYCGIDMKLFNPPDMVKDGVYFDSTPCLDVDTAGKPRMNPFVLKALATTGLYTSGGILNLISIVLLLVSIAKVKEHSKLMKFQTLEASDEL